MRHALPSVLLAAAFHALAVGPVSPPEQIVTNDNRGSAGVLRNGVLTIRLEGREGEWHPEGDSEAGIIVRAFAEKGRRLLVPGPLIRVPEGTEIHAYVTNTSRAAHSSCTVSRDAVWRPTPATRCRSRRLRLERCADLLVTMPVRVR